MNIMNRQNIICFTKPSFYLLILLINTHVTILGQSPSSFWISGRCHDNSTALGLKASIYSLNNGYRELIGKCSEDGNFKVRLPVTSTNIILAMKGYHSVDIPVDFAPYIPPNAQFTIGYLGAMVLLDSLDVLREKGSNPSIYFELIDTINVKYQLSAVESLSTNVRGIFFKDQNRMSVFFHAIPTGNYIIDISTIDGKLISSEKITLKSGITFKAVRIVKPAQVDPLGNIIHNSISSLRYSNAATLYFDQSRYDLRPSVKAELDSIARLLIMKKSLIATITGYTDNVGNGKLNMTLSEYRSRSVANYLIRSGVSANQLVTKWKGPAPNSLPEDKEEVKAKSRRVIIQIISK